MKKKDLERKLNELGWWFLRAGGNHDQWTNGVIGQSVPRHREIGESLARKILKKAVENPPEK